MDHHSAGRATRRGKPVDAVVYGKPPSSPVQSTKPALETDVNECRALGEYLELNRLQSSQLRRVPVRPMSPSGDVGCL